MLQKSESHEFSRSSTTSLSVGHHRSHGHRRLKRQGLPLLMVRLSKLYCKNTWAQGGEETLKPYSQIIYQSKERCEVMQSEALPTNYHSSRSVRGHTKMLSVPIPHIRFPWVGWKEKIVPWNDPQARGKRAEGNFLFLAPFHLQFFHA